MIFSLFSLLQEIRTLREGVMLRNLLKSLVMCILFASALVGWAYAESASSLEDTTVGSGIDYSSTYKGISKVKPNAPAPTKVKPYTGLMSGFDALSRYNPVAWGPDCLLPVPAKGQFLVGPKLFFARLRGDAHRDLVPTATTPAQVDFQDHLGFKQTGHMIWSIEALYQFRPTWGFRYSFSPMALETSGQAKTSFVFGGQSFAVGSVVRTRWERFQHRAGLLVNLSHSSNSLTSLYADWLHIEDRLVAGGATGPGATVPVIWNDNKNLAVLGLEFGKCLKNYRGNTLALECKGGIAFLDDSLGYEAEAGLTYMIPIKTGRFGFVKGGYQYMHLKKEKDLEHFSTFMDGAFLKIGFLF